MGYAKRLFGEALAKTWDKVAAAPVVTIIISLAVVAVSWLVQHGNAGKGTMRADALQWLISVLPVVVVFLAIFLVYLLFLTPRKIYAAQQSEIETLQKRLADIVKIRPRFVSIDPRIEYPPSQNQPGAAVSPVMSLKFLNKGEHDSINLRGHITVATSALNREPEIRQPMEAIDAIARDVPQNFAHPLGPLPGNAPETLIHVGFEFEDAITGKQYSQSFYLLWRGTSNGSGLLNFFSATFEQRDSMRKYLGARGFKTYDPVPEGTATIQAAT